MATPLGFPQPLDTDKMRYAMQRLRELASAIDTYLTRTAPAVAYAGTWGHIGGTLTSRVEKRGGIVTVAIGATKTAASVAGEVILTLPAGYRPVAETRAFCNNAGAPRPVTISSAGVVTNDNAQSAGLAALVGSFTFIV